MKQLIPIFLFLSSLNNCYSQNGVVCDSTYHLNLFFFGNTSHTFSDNELPGAYEPNIYCCTNVQITPDPTIWSIFNFSQLDIGEGDTLNLYIGGKDCERFIQLYSFTNANDSLYLDFFLNGGFLQISGGYFEIEWITDEAFNGTGWEFEISPFGYAEYPLISGTLKTEINQPINKGKLRFSTLPSFPSPVDTCLFTDTDGSNSIDYWITFNSSYHVILKPESGDDYVNGVTTSDMVLILKHILGVQPLNSNYKMVAADVNNSGHITALDLVWIRKLILGTVDEFPNNTSWRFVTICEDFSNGIGNLQEEVAFVGTMPKTFRRFVAIKIGDVNNSADPDLE